nr:hypothetical protein Iba_chr05aCG6420 [Ipomoea batatas]GMC91953.1 hypothetical protein Iba_chr05aCG6440 [Ipomoea batatas]
MCWKERRRRNCYTGGVRLSPVVFIEKQRTPVVFIKKTISSNGYKYSANYCSRSFNENWKSQPKFLLESHGSIVLPLQETSHRRATIAGERSRWLHAAKSRELLLFAV